MCNSLDLKRDDGLNVLLDQIVDELRDLEINGIEIDTLTGPVTVRATLAQFTGDNLGMNQILGFIESFSCDYCCVLCYATREKMQVDFREN